MNQEQEFVISTKKLEKAIQRLELLSQPSNLQLLDELSHATNHLTVLSKQVKTSPFQLKKKLEALKEAGFVYSPQRFPNAYAVNRLQCIKVGLKTKKLIAV